MLENIFKIRVEDLTNQEIIILRMLLLQNQWANSPTKVTFKQNTTLLHDLELLPYFKFLVFDTTNQVSFRAIGQKQITTRDLTNNSFKARNFGHLVIFKSTRPFNLEGTIEVEKLSRRQKGHITAIYQIGFIYDQSDTNISQLKITTIFDRDYLEDLIKQSIEIIKSLEPEQIVSWKTTKL